MDNNKQMEPRPMEPAGAPQSAPDNSQSPTPVSGQQGAPQTYSPQGPRPESSTSSTATTSHREDTQSLAQRVAALQGLSATPLSQSATGASRPAFRAQAPAGSTSNSGSSAHGSSSKPFDGTNPPSPQKKKPGLWDRIKPYFVPMTWPKAFNLAVYAFAFAGFLVFAAWGAHSLGLTKNHGGYDSDARYLTSADDVKSVRDSSITQVEIDEMWANQYMRLAAFAKFYPQNARIILAATQYSSDPQIVDRMIAAAMVYGDHNRECQKFMEDMSSRAKKQKQYNQGNAIPWMDGVAWQHLKRSIVKDTAELYKAGAITGVEPRLIAACLVGEQIRLYNSRRESLKKYMGPVKALSVESNFSYGVNGIKDFTAAAVERHLTDPKSPYYMGKHYEHILDFETEDHAEERYRRLVDYRSHLYSYIYTGCILHQTMLQWRRAGYDISNRPDVLCTLFNLGFQKSKPHADPRCGGAAVNIEGRTYVFGAIGYDFYYSGELAEILGYWPVHFIDDNGKALTQKEIMNIQNTRSDCARPVRGHEYQTDSSSSSSATSNGGSAAPASSDDDDELLSF